MFAALADALEVGLDLAVELETDASGATREGVLNDIASQLISRRRTANGQQLVIYDGSKGAQWLRWALTALGRRAGEKEGGKNWVWLARIDLCRRARRKLCDWASDSPSVGDIRCKPSLRPAASSSRGGLQRGRRPHRDCQGCCRPCRLSSSCALQRHWHRGRRHGGDRGSGPRRGLSGSWRRQGLHCHVHGRVELGPGLPSLRRRLRGLQSRPCTHCTVAEVGGRGRWRREMGVRGG